MPIVVPSTVAEPSPSVGQHKIAPSRWPSSGGQRRPVADAPLRLQRCRDGGVYLLALLVGQRHLLFLRVPLNLGWSGSLAAGTRHSPQKGHSAIASSSMACWSSKRGPNSRPITQNAFTTILGVQAQAVQDSGRERGWRKVSQHLTALLPELFILQRRLVDPVFSWTRNAG